MDASRRHCYLHRGRGGHRNHTWPLVVVLRLVSGPGSLDDRLSVWKPRGRCRVQHGPHVCLAARAACHRTCQSRVVLDNCSVELDRSHRTRSGGGLWVEATDGIRAHSTWAHWTNAPRSRCCRPLFGCSSRMIEAGIDNSHLALCQNCVTTGPNQRQAASFTGTSTHSDVAGSR